PRGQFFGIEKKALSAPERAVLVDGAAPGN
ncbi:MAG: hypothetical protein ACI9K5_004198, partial [Gammaproteobacteria bacterium]